MLLPLLHWSCTVSTFQVSQNSTCDRHCCMNIVISSFKAWVRTHCCMFFCAEAFFLPLLIYFCGPFTKRLFFVRSRVAVMFQRARRSSSEFFLRKVYVSAAFVPTSEVSGKLKISCAAPSTGDVVRWAGRFRPNTWDGILKGHSFCSLCGLLASRVAALLGFKMR